MLLQDELVSRSLSSTGQVYVHPALIRYTDERIMNDFMIPCAAEYQTLRPPVVWEHVMIPSEGWQIPSRVRRINGLRPLWLYYWPYSAAIALRPIPRMEDCKWFITNNILYAPPGRYELEFISTEGYTIAWEVPKHVVYRPSTPQTTLTFKLRVHIRPGTLKIYYGPENAVQESQYLIATDNGTGMITGSFLTSGLIDYQTNEVVLVPNGTATPWAYPLQASFAALNPGIKELNWQDVYFIDLFDSRFLTAYAATRSLVQIDGLPVNINADDLLNYARSKEQAWITARENKVSSWWRW